MTGVVRCYSYQAGQWYYSIGQMMPHDTDTRYVSLKTDTGDGGASGSPLFRYTSTGLKVVGIHLGRNKLVLDNYGTVFPDPFERPKFLQETSFRDKYSKVLADWEDSDFSYDSFKGELSYDEPEDGFSLEDYFIPDQIRDYSVEDADRILNLENQGKFRRHKEPVVVSGKSWASIMSEESENREAGQELIVHKVVPAQMDGFVLPKLVKPLPTLPSNADNERVLESRVDSEPLNLRAPPLGGVKQSVSASAETQNVRKKKKKSGPKPVNSTLPPAASSQPTAGVSAVQGKQNPSEQQRLNNRKAHTKRWAELQAAKVRAEVLQEVLTSMRSAPVLASSPGPVGVPEPN